MSRHSIAFILAALAYLVMGMVPGLIMALVLVHGCSVQV
jgi:hypothetical protein